MKGLHEIKVQLSENQKNNLFDAFKKKQQIILRLKNDSLSGSDTLYVPETVKKRLEKNRKLKKGMEIKIAKSNIRKQVQVGGSLWSSAFRMFGPTIGKTLGLSALAGLASEGASQVVKAITGKGSSAGAGAPRLGKYRPPRQYGGFLVPKDNVSQLLNILNLLTKGQKNDIMRALQTGDDLFIKPTEKQTGGAIGTILASIGIPMLLNAITGKGAGAGAGAGVGKLHQSPPFFGSWENYGRGKKKQQTGKGLILGKNSPFKDIPLIGDIF